jgi:hypothetical protein
LHPALQRINVGRNGDMDVDSQQLRVAETSSSDRTLSAPIAADDSMDSAAARTMPMREGSPTMSLISKADDSGSLPRLDVPINCDLSTNNIQAISNQVCYFVLFSY